MMEEIFDWCVDLLVFLAAQFGITYKEINVWIFVILWPLITLVLLIIIFVQFRRIRNYQRQEELNSPLEEKS